MFFPVDSSDSFLGLKPAMISWYINVGIREDSSLGGPGAHVENPSGGSVWHRAANKCPVSDCCFGHLSHDLKDQTQQAPNLSHS